jgi:hypothetical protein
MDMVIDFVLLLHMAKLAAAIASLAGATVLAVATTDCYL